MADIKTADQLQAELDAANASLTKEQTDHAATKELLVKEQQDHADEETNHLATMEVNIKLQEKNEALEMQLKNVGAKPEEKAVSKKPEIPSKTFKVDDEDYLFTVPRINYKGKIITATEALVDGDILAALVKMKFGGIKRAGA